MAIYTFSYVYRGTDFTPARVDLELGSFTLSPLATPQKISILDDDGVLEDNVNAGGQTKDTTEQVLDTAFGAFPAGTSVYSRVTYSVSVTYPDGSVHSGLANQIVIGGVRYTNFQFIVPPGSTVNFNSYNSIGNTAYSNFVPCFTAGTLIETETGERPAEALRVGDRVMTLDNGLQAIRWIGTRRIDPAELSETPALRPVRIARGAMSGDLPRRTLHVSPQHRMLLRSAAIAHRTGSAEVLIAAKKLTACAGIDVSEDLGAVTYVHLLFDRHEIVFAEGAPAESLYPGPQALRALGPDAVQEIAAIFPELALDAGDVASTPPEPARPIAEGQTQKSITASLAGTCCMLLA